MVIMINYGNLFLLVIRAIRVICGRYSYIRKLNNAIRIGDILIT